MAFFAGGYDKYLTQEERHRCQYGATIIDTDGQIKKMSAEEYREYISEELFEREREERYFG